MKIVKVELTGISPLLMHNARSVDITDPLVKELKKYTSKTAKKRTDTDEEQIDRISYELAIYHNGEFIYVPDVAILGSIKNGAKAQRLGKDCTIAVDVYGQTEIPLIYDGPKDIETLYSSREYVDRRVVRIGLAQIMRIRPRFAKWKIAFPLIVDDTIMALSKVKDSVIYAGSRVGLLDFRPKFGRYEVSKWEVA